MADERAFLGSGWSFPPRFSRGGADVEMVSGSEDVHQSLQILLSTQPGERIMQERFGCGLNEFLFEEVDQGLINRLRRLVSEAILYHEPRVDLERVSVSQGQSEPGLLLIAIEYRIRSTNSRYNMVYPFYLREAVGGRPFEGEP